MTQPASPLDAVLAHYGLRRAGEPLPVTNGTLNDNHRVETNAGPVFVRRHRADRDEVHILGEHAVIAFAAEHGIPVASPLVTAQGPTVVAESGSLWAVFPWVHGRVAERGAVTAAQAYALGDMLGRIHTVFATHPRSAGGTFQMRWDKDETLRVLGACIDRATQLAEPAEVLDALVFQRSLLERSPIEPPEYFTGLPCQLTHGDYHAEQVIFTPGDAVAAVVDWEMYQAAARVWEVIRSLSFSQLLHTPLLEEYLRGYRQHARLDKDEVRLGVQLWWQSRVNGAWLWYACFLQGNDRVRPLFPSVVPELERLADPRDREALTDRIIASAGA